MVETLLSKMRGRYGVQRPIFLQSGDVIEAVLKFWRPNTIRMWVFSKPLWKMGPLSPAEHNEGTWYFQARVYLADWHGSQREHLDRPVDPLESWQESYITPRPNCYFFREWPHRSHDRNMGRGSGLNHLESGGCQENTPNPSECWSLWGLHRLEPRQQGYFFLSNRRTEWSGFELSRPMQMLWHIRGLENTGSVEYTLET